MLKQSIKNKYKIVSMAYNRTTFKNRVEEKIGGAFFEYLKGEYAKCNNETKWVKHWTSEVDRLLDSELVVVLLHDVTFKNVKKAALEVVSILQNKVDKYKLSAKKQLETKYFKRSFSQDIKQKSIDLFFSRIKQIIEDNC